VTLESMLAAIRNRTHESDTQKTLTELNLAKDWAFDWVFTMGKDLFLTIGEELTPSTSATTRTYDLAANVTVGTLYGIKLLKVRFASDSTFTPVAMVDSNDPRFISNDIYPSSDSTTAASSHPVYVDVQNFDQIRFAPPLPISAVLCVDYYRKAPDFSLDTNAAITNDADMPEPFHPALIDKATGQILHYMDDSRWGEYEVQADRKLYQAMNVIRDRQSQNPQRTAPFGQRRRKI
jgi:hypothetical protein